MARPTKKLLLCPLCDRIFEYEKRSTKVRGKSKNYRAVIYHEALTKLGLPKEVCDNCKKEKNE